MFQQKQIECIWKRSTRPKHSLLLLKRQSWRIFVKSVLSTCLSSGTFQLLKCHSGGGVGQLRQCLALLQHLSHTLHLFKCVLYHKLEGMDVAQILDEVVRLLDGFDLSKTITLGCLNEQKQLKQILNYHVGGVVVDCIHRERQGVQVQALDHVVQAKGDRRSKVPLREMPGIES